MQRGHSCGTKRTLASRSSGQSCARYAPMSAPDSRGRAAREKWRLVARRNGGGALPPVVAAQAAVQPATATDRVSWQGSRGHSSCRARDKSSCRANVGKRGCACTRIQMCHIQQAVQRCKFSRIEIRYGGAGVCGERPGQDGAGSSFPRTLLLLPTLQQLYNVVVTARAGAIQRADALLGNIFLAAQQCDGFVVANPTWIGEWFV